MQIFKRIISTISIIIATLGCGLGIYCFIISQTMGSIEFFGPIPNLLVFGVGVAVIFYAIILIIGLWIIYGIVKLIYNLYKKGKKMPTI